MAGACNASLPRVLTLAATAAPIAVDSTTVFYFQAALGQIRRVDKAGGTPVALAGGESGVDTIALDGTFVYWSTPVNGAIRRVSKGGGQVQTIATGGMPRRVAVDANHAYFYDELANVLLRTPKDGSGSASVFNSAIPSFVSSIVLDDTDVFFSRMAANWGYAVRQPKTATSTVASTLAGSNVELDGPDLFFAITKAGLSDTAIVRSDKNLVTKSTTSIPNPNAIYVNQIKVGRMFVYYSLGGSWTSKVHKCGMLEPYPRDNSQPGLGIPAPVNPVAPVPYALDEDFVYAAVNGELRRIPQ
ncbi:MAG: hypothetical protein AMXMBFR56_69370 [Polyangiaceae bacterium]